MTSAEIRQSFLDFFAEKRHTIVSSASLLPQSPGLLFTNAGMNQFVPYFLGVEKAPYDPPRAADTQKCIRAGGKHNDLEDVGMDSYHHTLFEMLGNWSFGDYFKAEAIRWAWELVVERWGFPAERVYATVYAPDKAKGDPGTFDQEAWDVWAALFRAKGLKPEVHIVDGNVHDNFWMMGETGPCGPCSEMHLDLTPKGDTLGNLVNAGTDRCIELWNLVFIQYNAEEDGSFRDLPAKHVDTGMGFERACSVIQNTKGFTDFSRTPSNYATDVFTPLFRKLEELSGKQYQDIYPELGAEKSTFSEEMKDAIAFRVIADHLRTLSFSIADGIIPGNSGRNYVLRRILRRAVRYGRHLGFHGGKPFFGNLVGTLVGQLGGVFPELREREAAIRVTLEREEASFNETLDRGLRHFEEALPMVKEGTLPGEVAFELYDTFGFPPDLTDLLCADKNIRVNRQRFDELMEQQRARARAARKAKVVRALEVSTEAVTRFTGFDSDEADVLVLEVHSHDGLDHVITDRTPFYAEMGGQVADSGILVLGPVAWDVQAVQQIGRARAHAISPKAGVKPGDTVKLRVDARRRRPIESHHTATHLLHWALHQAVSPEAAQQGSLVDETHLRFDFNSAAVSPAQIEEIERLVNAKIAEDAPVSWTEVPHREVKNRKDIMQFFGDKYGELVRVVQIGGEPGKLNGYSMELCGGTHVRRTGEIGLFKIVSEGAIAAGVRRIEAACGEHAWEHLGKLVAKVNQEADQLREKLDAANAVLGKLGEEPVIVNPAPRIMTALLVEDADVTRINQTLRALLDKVEELRRGGIDAEKQIKKIQGAAAARRADAALALLIEKDEPIVTVLEGDADVLQELLNGLKKKAFPKAAFLVVDDGEKLHLGSYCGAEALAQGWKADAVLRELGALAGGRGGGKADMARGAATERDKLPELEIAAQKRLS